VSVYRVSRTVPLTPNPEGDLLPYYTNRTWEWSPAFPLRSIVPVFLTTGIPLWFAEFFLKRKQIYAPLTSTPHLSRGTPDKGNITNIPFSTGTLYFLGRIWADW